MVNFRSMYMDDKPAWKRLYIGWPRREGKSRMAEKKYTVKEALAEAGVDTSGVPETVRDTDMPLLCETLGLQWHGPGQAEIPVGMPCVVIYEVASGHLRAEYVDDLGKHHFLQQAAGMRIFGLVTGLPEGE